MITLAVSALAFRTTRPVVRSSRLCFSSTSRMCAPESVTGVVYSADADRPTVQLFTKAGCTLCDVAKGVLASASAESPHTLEAIDITDADKAEWWDKYKYDIPVLHINNVYWAKHRIQLDETLQALASAKDGSLSPSPGEPDAARLERK